MRYRSGCARRRRLGLKRTEAPISTRVILPDTAHSPCAARRKFNAGKGSSARCASRAEAYSHRIALRRLTRPANHTGGALGVEDSTCMA